MKRGIILLIIVLISFFFRDRYTTTNSDTAPTIQNESTTSKKQLYTVTKVIDGDTAQIDRDGHTTTLRFLGINTPEIDPQYNPVECYGKEASDETRRLLLGKKITIESDPNQSERDKYNRLLVYVFLEDGTHINEYLVRNGFAKEYTYNKTYRYQKEFQTAEVSAKQEQRGLWSENICP